VEFRKFACPDDYLGVSMYLETDERAKAPRYPTAFSIQIWNICVEWDTLPWPPTIVAWKRDVLC
jgi:hypothetical protein